MMRPLLVALVAAAGLIGGAHGFKAVDVTQTLQAKGAEQKTEDLQIPKILACTKKKCDLGFAGDFEMTLGTYESKTLMPVNLKIPVGSKEEDVPMASIHFSGDGPSHNSIKDFLVDALTGEVASSFCANKEKGFAKSIKAAIKGQRELKAAITTGDEEAAKEAAKKVTKDVEDKELKLLKLRLAPEMAAIGCDEKSITSTLAQKLEEQREPARKILEGLQILAGDTNISPAKTKQLKGLTKSTDLTGEIAKALDEISCYSAAPVDPQAAPASCPPKWHVYMANVLVGKKRTGYSLMNTQIFKSESGDPNYEFDGTLVAVKKEYETKSGFRVIGAATSSRMGDASTTKQEILGAPVKNAFTFGFTDQNKTVVDVDAVTTGSVFLDHAVIEFEIWSHRFVVLNVASVIDVMYKDWGAGKKRPFYQWFDHELIDGINTMKELDQKLYECQQTRLKELYGTTGGLSNKVEKSLKQVFKEEYATDFDGMRTLKSDTTSFFYPENCVAGDVKLIRDKLVQGMGDFVDHVAGTCAGKTASAAAYFNTANGDAKKFVCSGKTKIDAKKKAWVAAVEKKNTAKDILKFTGEQLVKIGFYQPYGGFGDAVAHLGTTAERKIVSPTEIYKIIASIAKKGKVIVGSEISVKRIIPKDTHA